MLTNLLDCTVLTFCCLMFLFLFRACQAFLPEARVIKQLFSVKGTVDYELEFLKLSIIFYFIIFNDDKF